MKRRPTEATIIETPVPYTTLCRTAQGCFEFLPVHAGHSPLVPRPEKGSRITLAMPLGNRKRAAASRRAGAPASGAVPAKGEDYRRTFSARRRTDLPRRLDPRPLRYRPAGKAASPKSGIEQLDTPGIVAFQQRIMGPERRGSRPERRPLAVDRERQADEAAVDVFGLSHDIHRLYLRVRHRLDEVVDRGAGDAERLQTLEPLGGAVPLEDRLNAVQDLVLVRDAAGEIGRAHV